MSLDGFHFYLGSFMVIYLLNPFGSGTSLALKLKGSLQNKENTDASDVQHF